MVRSTALARHVADLITSVSNKESAERLIIAAELASLKGFVGDASVTKEAFRLSGIERSEIAEVTLQTLLANQAKNKPVPPNYFSELRTLVKYIEPEDADLRPVQAVVTLPPNIRDELSALTSAQLPDTIEVIDELIDSAQTDLLVVAAFAHKEGAKLFAPRLSLATKRRVIVTLLTQKRTKTYDPSPAVEELLREIKSSGDPNLFSVHFLDFLTGNLHAKLFVADGKLAYVGSANLTGYALTSNIEAGALMRGPEAQHLKNLFRFILGSTSQNSSV